MMHSNMINHLNYNFHYVVVDKRDEAFSKLTHNQIVKKIAEDLRKIDGIDCISIGPDMFDVHTPDEKISISSIARVWEFLKLVLAAK